MVYTAFIYQIACYATVNDFMGKTPSDNFQG